MTNEHLIGQKIVDARTKQQISQTQLAEYLTVSSQAVSKWESGDSLPDILQLDKMALFLGVDLNYFSNRDDEDNARPVNAEMHNWKDSDFSRTNIEHSLAYSNIKNCIFDDANMSGVQLNVSNINSSYFSNANMSGSKLHATHMAKSNLVGANLSRASIKASNLGFNNFNEANFDGTVFKASRLSKNTFNDSVFNNTEWRSCLIKDTIFYTDFESCNFINCNLKGVEFNSCSLKNVFFNNCNLKKCIFRECSVDKITQAFLVACKATLINCKVE